MSKEAMYKKEVGRLVDILKDYEPEKIILFGSVARGKIRENSDIDLCLLKRFRGKTADEYSKVYDLLWRSNYDYPMDVDIKVYHPKVFGEKLKKGYPFMKEIAEKGEIVYEGQKATSF